MSLLDVNRFGKLGHKSEILSDSQLRDCELYIL